MVRTSSSAVLTLRLRAPTLLLLFRGSRTLWCRRRPWLRLPCLRRPLCPDPMLIGARPSLLLLALRLLSTVLLSRLVRFCSRPVEMQSRLHLSRRRLRFLSPCRFAMRWRRARPGVPVRPWSPNLPRRELPLGLLTTRWPVSGRAASLSAVLTVRTCSEAVPALRLGGPPLLWIREVYSCLPLFLVADSVSSSPVIRAPTTTPSMWSRCFTRSSLMTLCAAFRLSGRSSTCRSSIRT